MLNHDNDYYEKLSALVDGETSNTEMPEADLLLNEILDADRSRQAWQAYHLTRDVLQADYKPALPTDFWARVSTKLEAEETYSKDDGQDDAAPHVMNILPFEKQSPPQQPASDVSLLARSNRRWKSVAALGMAASVALASVAAMQLFNNQGNSSAGPKIARLAPGSSTVEPVALTSRVVPTVLTGGGTHWRGSEKQHTFKVEERLNSYLTNHLEDAVLGGMISHTRVVGYDTSDLRSESF